MMGINTIAGGGVQIRAIASALAQRLGRTVRDDTQLTGEYQFVLTFTPELPSGIMMYVSPFWKRLFLISMPEPAP